MKLRDLRELDKDDLLRLVGLRTKRSAAEWMLPCFGLFSLGMLVGAGVALLTAPKSGRELREQLRERAKSINEELAGSLSGGGPSAERPPRTF
ncbi:MAG TPA: YtxH domain-containing protein [Myxococcaceae bacterium]|nr:YtxH domain-containing protein [Myxococcaceae bacterium]